MNISTLINSKFVLWTMLNTLTLSLYQINFRIPSITGTTALTYILMALNFLTFVVLLRGFCHKGLSRTLYLSGSLLIIIAAIMKITHLKFADIILIISIITLCISFVVDFITHQTKSIKSISLLIFLLFILVAVLFKLLHLKPELMSLLLTIAYIGGIKHLLVLIKMSSKSKTSSDIASR